MWVRTNREQLKAEAQEKLIKIADMSIGSKAQEVVVVYLLPEFAQK